MRRDQERKDGAQKAESDFKDFMDGKAPQKEKEESLQDLFKSFYTKAKAVNHDVSNSAMNSLNGFSSRLE